jgi:23S rRNA pseudouridine1911/1915/1917 synthase
VTPDRDGERLDVFLAAATDLSRRSARRAIDDGLVRRNGDRLRVQSRSLAAGDVIDVQLPGSKLGAGSGPPPVPCDFLFEDRWLMIAAKPAGVLSQPAEGKRHGDPDAFDQQILLALAWRDGRRPYLRLVHRLDRLTSGVMLFARSPDALPELLRAWRDGLVDRYYLAIVEGRPESNAFAIDRPIARDRSHRWRFKCDQSGKAARTEIEVLATVEDDLSVVGCRLVTGRTHQVRVHLAAAGHPVIGDRLYNSRRADQVGRPLLHAATLALPHPGTGERLRVVCPPPFDIAEFLPDDLDISEL